MVDDGTGTFDHPSVSPDLYVQGNIEADGTIYGTLSGPLVGILSDGAGIGTFSYNGTTNATVAVNVDGTTIGINGADALYLMDNSVTSAKIVDGAILDADVNAAAAIAGTKIILWYTKCSHNRQY